MVWRCDLDRGIASLDTLDRTERERAAAFVFEHHRRRYIVAHVFLRAVLAQSLSVTPASLRFAATEHHKPYLKDHPTVAFNMSHADGVAYVAIAAAGDLGVDVELHHSIDDLLGVARLVFSASEVAEVREAAGEERIVRFLRCWTRKEAYVKALGVGLGTELTSITVGTWTDDVVVPPLQGISDLAFHVRTVPSRSGEHVAIATSVRPGTIEVVDWNSGD